MKYLCGCTFPKHKKGGAHTDEIETPKKPKKGHSPMKYWTLHRWVRANKPKPKLCVCCNVVPPKDIANISGLYKQDVNDFEWLCRSCHMKKDGRIKNLALMASHKGEKSGMAKLDEKRVLLIKKSRLEGLSYSKISKIYSISISHAQAICTGVRWGHLTFHLSGKRKP